MKPLLTLVLSIMVLSGFSQRIDSLALIQFKDQVLELQNSELLRNGSLSVQLKRVASNENIFAVNQHLSVPSASTLKLITTSTALAIFGSNYHYVTYLEYSGKVVSDTLFGNIYVRGTGDPSLGSVRFDGQPTSTELLSSWSHAIGKLGIRYVKGRIIADATYFEGASIADSWIWGDIGNAYGAGVYGLNLNENYYTVQLVPGRNIGDPVTFRGTSPPLPYIYFENLLTTGARGSGDKSIFYANPLSNAIQFVGTIPAGPKVFSVRGAIPNVPLFIEKALQESLQKDSIGVEQVFDVAYDKTHRMEIAKYHSRSLEELCRQTNLWSINLYADAFLRNIGKKLEGKSDFDSSVEAVKKYWSDKGADMRGFMVKDGSGLSPSGSLTAGNMTEVLCLISKNAVFKDFYDGLAVLGATGTVRRLGRKTNAANNIRAKSGSIEGTRAYAGYVTTKSGGLLAFSLLAHKYQPKADKEIVDELEKLMVSMAEL
tara:strand:- start:97 stop:1554 length:1458 start_codon:yes stop_codon:yes gene_type:complete